MDPLHHHQEYATGVVEGISRRSEVEGYDAFFDIMLWREWPLH